MRRSSNFGNILQIFSFLPYYFYLFLKTWFFQDFDTQLLELFNTNPTGKIAMLRPTKPITFCRGVDHKHFLFVGGIWCKCPFQGIFFNCYGCYKKRSSLQWWNHIDLYIWTKHAKMNEMWFVHPKVYTFIRAIAIVHWERSTSPNIPSNKIEPLSSKLSLKINPAHVHTNGSPIFDESKSENHIHLRPCDQRTTSTLHWSQGCVFLVRFHWDQ